MPFINKKMTLITSEPFWRQGAGCRTRLLTLVNYLSQHIQLNIIYLGTPAQDDSTLPDHLEIPFSYISATNIHAEPQDEYLSQLTVFLSENSHADIYLIDKAENSYVLDVLPDNAIKILDADDLVHKRNNSMKKYGITDQYELSSRQERALFNRYNAIICIQKDEYNIARLWANTCTCLLVPHPVFANPQPLVNTPKRIGIIASGWHANINGLDYFIKHVWPEFSNKLSLHIYGHAANAFTHINTPDIELHGFQENIAACYNNIDIVINPVFYGAGLKIKTVEAMAYGLPLITTREGASGLTELSGQAFLIADTAEQFIHQINALLDDAQLRQRLTGYAQAYISEHMNEKHCFEPLIAYLTNC